MGKYCSDCGDVLSPGARKCRCGAKVEMKRTPYKMPPVFREMSEACRATIKKIGMEKYRGESSSDYAKRCREYIGKTFPGAMPTSIQKQIDEEKAKDEAKTEREAIQAEG